MLRQCVPDVVQRPAFICGPNAMAEAAREELISVGVPAERINVESFTPAGAVAKDNAEVPADEMAGASRATVTFQRSGQSAPLPQNKTVLDAAESVGVAIDYQCRSGICGTCRCKLVSGRVTMPVRDALSEADEADGYILACQAHATDDVVVDA
jgi:ferredoxin